MLVGGAALKVLNAPAVEFARRFVYMPRLLGRTLGFGEGKGGFAPPILSEN
jgi:hypothetical protein